MNHFFSATDLMHTHFPHLHDSRKIKKITQYLVFNLERDIK